MFVIEGYLLVVVNGTVDFALMIESVLVFCSGTTEAWTQCPENGYSTEGDENYFSVVCILWKVLYHAKIRCQFIWKADALGEVENWNEDFRNVFKHTEKKKHKHLVSYS